MKNLKEISQDEQAEINGGGFREIGRAIGNWLDSWNSGTKKGCGSYDDSTIPGSASNNFVS